MNPITHVAIIMDGNGRWGLKYKNNRNSGHKAGLLTIEKVIKETVKQKIKFLTLYTFSTENWKRPVYEINYLFQLLENFLTKKINLLIKNKIRLKIIGNKKAFTKKIKKLLDVAEKKTSMKDNVLQINLALNYGSKDELINAIKNLSKSKLNINYKNLEKYLYTNKIPDPDLLIRTGNTNRLSNFLLWQIAYTDIFFIKKLWPDFNEIDYKKVLNKFRKLKRNFGQI
jgi:undecaprenyl diphosphate synthase